MRAIIALVLASIAPLTAYAQECAGGRVATQEGYCCWPGQRWDDADQRCEGPPSCPAPLHAAGSECVTAGEAVAQPAPPPAAPDMVSAEGAIDYGSGATATPAPVVVQPTGEIGTAWPSAGQIPPEGSRNPHHETRSDEALQIAGAVILGAGYLEDLIVAPIAFADWRGVDSIGYGYERDSTCHDAIAGSLFAPLVGGFFAWGVQQNCNTPTYVSAGGVQFLTGSSASSVRYASNAWSVLGAITAGAQLVGLGLLLAGSFHMMQVTVYENASTTLHVGPMLGGVVGADATLRF